MNFTCTCTIPELGSRVCRDGGTPRAPAIFCDRSEVANSSQDLRMLRHIVVNPDYILLSLKYGKSIPYLYLEAGYVGMAVLPERLPYSATVLQSQILLKVRLTDVATNRRQEVDKGLKNKSNIIIC